MVLFSFPNLEAAEEGTLVVVVAKHLFLVSWGLHSKETTQCNQPRMEGLCCGPKPGVPLVTSSGVRGRETCGRQTNFLSLG